MPPVSGIEAVDYDGLIVDLDGVVWRGDEPIDGAAGAIAAVRANGVRVFRPDLVLESLAALPEAMRAG